MQLQSLYYEVNGLKLHVLACGNNKNKTLLLLHGFPEPALAWKAQLQFFASKGYYALAPDQRGYNKSSKPKGVKEYTIEKLVQDMVSLIQQVTTDKVVVVGHDWGGGVAWHLAMYYPQMLHKLVIINMPHPHVMLQTLKKNPQQMLRSTYILFFQIPLIPQWLLRAFNFKILKQTLIKTAQKDTFSTELLQHYQDAWEQPGAITSMLNWYRAYKYSKQSPDKNVVVPTLIIWGDKDQFLIKEMAPKSAARCSNSKLEMINDATHWIYHEQPFVVNTLILEFILK